MRWLTFESSSDAFRDAICWVRRCAEPRGRRPLRPRAADQPPQEPPAPLPGMWGDPPSLPSALAQAALEGDLAGKVHVLASDPKDGLAAALARLGRAFLARDS